LIVQAEDEIRTAMTLALAFAEMIRAASAAPASYYYTCEA
jgi:hypothetical protein